ncbi:MAG: hypothetical protein ACRES1_06675, partial [Steroidobacteraceae bacterium]
MDTGKRVGYANPVRVAALRAGRKGLGDLAGGGYAVLRQQRADVRAAPAELDEGIQGVPAAAAGEDGI